MIASLAIGFVFFAGCLSILFSIGQWFVRERRPANLNLAALFLTIGILMLQMGFIFDGVAFDHPDILLFHLTMMYALTPLLYFAYYLVILPEESLPAWKVWLMVPTAVIFLADIRFAVFPASYRKSVLQFVLYGGRGVEVTAVKTLFIGAGVQFLAHLGFLFYRLIAIWDEPEHQGVLKITMGYIVFSILTVMFLSLGYTASSINLLRCGALLSGIMIVCAYFVGQRHPRFLQLLMIEAGKKRYGRSLLGRMDLKELEKKLLGLMDEKKLYTDDEVTLKQLADALSITPHQLSQLLNEQLNVNFNTFINQYRIRDAMEMLIHEPGRSVLSIAFAVGFNSKSSFYEAFFRHTGLTPHRYRRQRGHKDEIPAECSSDL